MGDHTRLGKCQNEKSRFFVLLLRRWLLAGFRDCAGVLWQPSRALCQFVALLYGLPRAPASALAAAPARLLLRILLTLSCSLPVRRPTLSVFLGVTP